ncbi:unnamed protein product [Ixodes pacificus]
MPSSDEATKKRRPYSSFLVNSYFTLQYASHRLIRIYIPVQTDSGMNVVIKRMLSYQRLHLFSSQPPQLTNPSQEIIVKYAGKRESMRVGPNHVCANVALP